MYRQFYVNRAAISNSSQKQSVYVRAMYLWIKFLQETDTLTHMDHNSPKLPNTDTFMCSYMWNEPWSLTMLIIVHFRWKMSIWLKVSWIIQIFSHNDHHYQELCILTHLWVILGKPCREPYLEPNSSPFTYKKCLYDSKYGEYFNWQVKKKPSLPKLNKVLKDTFSRKCTMFSRVRYAARFIWNYPKWVRAG